MSWDFFTWLAIGVLVFGSLIVFAWFVFDVGSMWRSGHFGIDVKIEFDDPEKPG